ncbi:MAG: glycosyltransferase family 4 protein [Nitrososphaera sp.]|nr:glycosyltransferase family 4 protein [Nitrososphaera sp.]
MLSVLHICTDFWPSTGGIEQFVLELAKRSYSIGIKASVQCFNRVKGHAERLPKTDAIDGVSITRVPFIDLRFYKPSLLPLNQLRKQDLLHVHGVGAPLDYVVVTKWLHKKPIIVSTHGGIFHTNTLLTVKRIYFYGFESFIMKGVNAAVACSRSDETLFRQISQRVVLLENAVDVTDYLQLPMDAKEPGRCLYVGRLSENKGIPELLKAFADAKRRGAQFYLRLAGPDQDRRTGEFQELARTLGISENVLFLGPINRDALMEEYCCAENFASASKYEGFGLSAIEAKAAGCRLVLNDNGAFKSLFQTDAAASLVDFSDVPKAGALLFQVLSSTPNAKIQKARMDVIEYSWEKKIQDWKKLYSSQII